MVKVNLITNTNWSILTLESFRSSIVQYAFRIPLRIGAILRQLATVFAQHKAAGPVEPQ
jgi:hypothetical protein